MHTEDPEGAKHTNPAAMVSVGPLRFMTIDVPAVPQRRRGPRRRSVDDCLVERRAGDRRESKPGVDGLLRMVLADDWK